MYACIPHAFPLNTFFCRLCSIEFHHFYNSCCCYIDFLVLHSIQFVVKKEGFGGGGSRMLQFHQGHGDVTFLKASGRTLNVTIGPGLASSTSELNN